LAKLISERKKSLINGILALRQIPDMEHFPKEEKYLGKTPSNLKNMIQSKLIF